MCVPNCMISDCHGWYGSPPRYSTEQRPCLCELCVPSLLAAGSLELTERIAVPRGASEPGPPSDPLVLSIREPGAAPQLDVRGGCQRG